jgi:hypothetical protein
VDNYFNYFTEIEERFQRRRGSLLLLSTLDWALIETWKDAGIPLDAVLRGIDSAFDRYDQRPTRSRKVNSLAYCSQEVLASAEDMKDAAIGVSKESTEDNATHRQAASGFNHTEITAYLRRNAERLEVAVLPSREGITPQTIARDAGQTLRDLADGLTAKPTTRLEDLERHLTVLEEKLFAILLAAAPDADVVSVRAQADRELAPYRSKMAAPQIEQLQKQYLQKRLFEKYNLPRLSLFYM